MQEYKEEFFEIIKTKKGLDMVLWYLFNQVHDYNTVKMRSSLIEIIEELR